MPNLFYNNAKLLIFNQTLDLVADTIKIMLVSNAVAYTPNADHDFIAAGGANDPDDAESNVTNYTRAFGGAGRKTLGSKAIVVNDTDDRAEFDAADVTWTALGNGTNQTIVGGIIVKEITTDADSLLIAYVDFSDFTTNGANLTLQWDTVGIIHLTSFLGALQMFPKMLYKIWSWFSEKLDHKQVEKLKTFGIKPHIYRYAEPIRFSLKRA